MELYHNICLSHTILALNSPVFPYPSAARDQVTQRALSTLFFYTSLDWLLIGVLHSGIISGRVLLCDTEHCGNLIVLPHWKTRLSTITWNPTHSHYPNTEPTSPFTILTMPSTRQGNDFEVIGFTRPEFEHMRFKSHDLPKRKTDTQPIWSSHVVPLDWID